MTELINMLNTMQTNILTVTVPLGIIMVIVALIYFLIEPILPDMARENRGWIRRAFVTIAVIPWVPALVAFFFGS